MGGGDYICRAEQHSYFSSIGLVHAVREFLDLLHDSAVLGSSSRRPPFWLRICVLLWSTWSAVFRPLIRRGRTGAPKLRVAWKPLTWRIPPHQLRSFVILRCVGGRMRGPGSGMLLSWESC